ncbi:MAG: succinate dehydrogenase [Deltaproteobacteria bacterium]|nr:succinate dehydrogenase [Deltaproteobacteria bacterium]
MEKNGTLTLENVRTLRQDLWWLEPLAVVLGLGSFIVYTTWAALQNAHYYAPPYLSPFYSPCISANCTHVTVPLIGSWWNLSPAILILWIPAGFRATCYYYRKAYYRAFFWLPPACAVKDVSRTYTGETRFPFILQNMHRYFFYLATIVVAFLWWDVIWAFNFPNGFGIGIGTLVLLVNAVLLSLYSFSCHSCRHFCGGKLHALSAAPGRYTIWRLISGWNERHMQIAWVSLIWVAVTDLYVRLLSMGVIQDIRLI